MGIAQQRGALRNQRPGGAAAGGLGGGAAGTSRSFAILRHDVQNYMYTGRWGQGACALMGLMAHGVCRAGHGGC